MQIKQLLTAGLGLLAAAIENDHPHEEVNELPQMQPPAPAVGSDAFRLRSSGSSNGIAVAIGVPAMRIDGVQHFVGPSGEWEKADSR